MSASQFDGSAAFPGGGFMTQLSQLTDSSPSPAKIRDARGVRPLTVKQLSGASQSGDDKSSFLIDGVGVTNVTLVGMVVDKDERVTDVGFTLDDGTGRIACKRWFNETFDKQEMEAIDDGRYVRLVGHLNQRQMVAFSLRPVTNFDEVAFHFIQCIHVHLLNSGKKPHSDALSQSVIETPSQNNDIQNEVKTNLLSQFSGQSSIVDGLKGADQMILDYLQLPSSLAQEKGIHKDVLSRQLKVPSAKIMESIRNLEEEGLIYSTIDEFHYKSTVGG